MPMGLPTYQEAVRGVGGDDEQLDEFLVARRRKTRIHKREKAVDAVSINVRSGEQLNHLSRIQHRF
jgi:hypothetical protein